MAIQKDTPATLKKVGGSYVVLPNDSMSLIRDPVSMAIWAYLLSKPESWVVRNAEIQERFDIGRDKTTASLSHLRDLGLVWAEFIRDDHGRVISRNLVCSSQPNNVLAEQRIHRNTDLPYYGKGVVLVSKDLLVSKEKDSNKRSKDSMSKPAVIDDRVKQVIDLLNSMTGSKYKASTKSHASNISGRLNDGHSVDDLMAVVRFKVGEWLHDPKMAQYLRPETLFQAGKFNGYLTAAKATQGPLAGLSAISRKNAQNLAGWLNEE